MKRRQPRHDIAEGLQKHFAELEAGTVMTTCQAKQQCLARNAREIESNLMPPFVELGELPTFTEIEDICLKQRPHRAAGLDTIPPEICRHAAVVIAPYLHNVIMKSFLTGIEPHSFKGGLLCPIWKQKLPKGDPSGYRGILLTNLFGKILHAWARARLLPTLLHRRAPGQLGGLPSQQTVTAIQLLRLHGKLGRTKRLSTAAIFVDLRAAFHHMLREFIFTIRGPMTKATLARILDPNEFDCEKLSQNLLQAAEQAPCDIPAALRVFIHDIHKKLRQQQPLSEARDRDHLWPISDSTCLCRRCYTALEQD